MQIEVRSLSVNFNEVEDMTSQYVYLEPLRVMHY